MRSFTVIVLMLYSSLSLAQDCQCDDAKNPCDDDFRKYTNRGLSFFKLGDYKRAKQSFLDAQKMAPKNCISILLQNTEVAISKNNKRKNSTKPLEFSNNFKRSKNEPAYILPSFKEIIINGDTVFIAEHEVTQKEWSFFCKHNNTQYSVSNPDFPVTNISWNDASEYCKWLTNKTGVLFRLLTDDEWIFALGKIPTSKLDEFSWAYGSNNEDLHLHPVKSKKPNTFGLFDMLGNASEWTMDWYRPNEAKDMVNEDDIEDFKLVLGCNYEDEIFMCKEVLKRSFEPTYTKETIGFRICTNKNREL